MLEKSLHRRRGTLDQCRRTFCSSRMTLQISQPAPVPTHFDCRIHIVIEVSIESLILYRRDKGNESDRSGNCLQDLKCSRPGRRNGSLGGKESTHHVTQRKYLFSNHHNGWRITVDRFGLVDLALW
jgi:hypothetical protein